MFHYSGLSPMVEMVTADSAKPPVGVEDVMSKALEYAIDREKYEHAAFGNRTMAWKELEASRRILEAAITALVKERDEYKVSNEKLAAFVSRHTDELNADRDKLRSDNETSRNMYYALCDEICGCLSVAHGVRTFECAEHRRFREENRGLREAVLANWQALNGDEHLSKCMFCDGEVKWEWTDDGWEIPDLNHRPDCIVLTLQTRGEA